MIREKIKSLAHRLMAQERSPHKLALTCCLGAFIGISPIIGGHTAMTFLFGWLLRLSIPAVFMISTLINNPWTMIFVYSLDHFFGKCLFALCKINHTQWEPSWMSSLSGFLEHHTGIAGLSLSAFLVGGNLLAFGISVMLYIPMKKIFQRVVSHKKR
ncbi:MAG TPA: DUF2062 domain-containing protein [Candidatus Babeliales bacterium]|nr:DUF2062 domain-containing protein [Candidatus Babeliales bacterium]